MRENSEKDEIISELIEKYAELEKETAFLRARRHEFMNQLNLIMAIANTVPPEQIESLICNCIDEIVVSDYNSVKQESSHEVEKNSERGKKGDVTGSYSSPYEERLENMTDESHAYCNILFDAVISAKKKEAKEKSITFLCDMDELKENKCLIHLFGGYEGAGILMNIINNAFDECLKLPEDKRKFEIKADRKSISASNTMAEERIDSLSGFNNQNDYTDMQIIETSKGENHGFGLKNIYKIVSKRKAKMDITTSDYRFNIRIYIE